MKETELTERIIACAYKVHNILGAGFLEKVYHNALKLELEKNGFLVQKKYPIPVYYESIQVGDYYADLMIDNHIIIEIKAVENLNKAHEVQLVNYLAATGFEYGLLINFGSSVVVKRKYRLYKTRQD
jgi:GxxExxY protein